MVIQYFQLLHQQAEVVVDHNQVLLLVMVLMVVQVVEVVVCQAHKDKVLEVQEIHHQ